MRKSFIALCAIALSIFSFSSITSAAEYKASTACKLAMQKETTIDANMVESSDYIVSNDTLLHCLYVKEVGQSGCLADQSCISYDEWQERPGNITASSPRPVFIQWFESKVQTAMAW